MTEVQRKVETKLEIPNFKSDFLTSSHHDVASNYRVFNDILHIVDDAIEDHTDRVKYRVKKIMR